MGLVYENRMISVRVRNIVKRFGEARALNNVSLQIDPGELFFLLGPSGCGKTTLLRILAGFYFPDEGTVHFGDRDVTALEPHRRNTGMMFQSYALWPHMTVLENVAFGLEQRKIPRDEVKRRAEEALDSVRMLEYTARKPNQLSGGQQQRVALARALVIRPQCLLLDEPLSNLDAKLREEMRAEIRRVCKEFRLTTIYVTHDQKEALSIADRLAVLDAGDVLQVGTPVEVYRRPRNRFVANFIGNTNFLSGRILSVDRAEATVRTDLGDLTGVLAEMEKPPPEGATVELSVRPESLRLAESEPARNGIAGEIGSATYYGEVAHYEFESRGVRLAISELNPRHFGRSQETAHYAWVEPEDVVILER